MRPLLSDYIVLFSEQSQSVCAEVIIKAQVREVRKINEIMGHEVSMEARPTQVPDAEKMHVRQCTRGAG
jgi:hypothetical protein